MPSGSRQAAWCDTADAQLKVGLKDVKQRHKLRATVEEDEVSGAQYENKLRAYYTSSNPTPQWANDARERLRKQKKRRRNSSSAGSEPDTEFLFESNIGAKHGDLMDSSASHKNLRSGALSIERLRDVNHSDRSQGTVHSLGFHPNSKVPVLFTASGDRRLRLFNVSQHSSVLR